MERSNRDTTSKSRKSSHNAGDMIDLTEDDDLHSMSQRGLLPGSNARYHVRTTYVEPLNQVFNRGKSEPDMSPQQLRESQEQTLPRRSTRLHTTQRSNEFHKVEQRENYIDLTK